VLTTAFAFPQGAQRADTRIKLLASLPINDRFDGMTAASEAGAPCGTKQPRFLSPLTCYAGALCRRLRIDAVGGDRDWLRNHGRTTRGRQSAVGVLANTAATDRVGLQRSSALLGPVSGRPLQSGVSLVEALRGKTDYADTQSRYVIVQIAGCCLGASWRTPCSRCRCSSASMASADAVPRNGSPKPGHRQG